MHRLGTVSKKYLPSYVWGRRDGQKDGSNGTDGQRQTYLPSPFVGDNNFVVFLKKPSMKNMWPPVRGLISFVQHNSGIVLISIQIYCCCVFCFNEMISCLNDIFQPMSCRNYVEQTTYIVLIPF